LAGLVSLAMSFRVRFSVIAIFTSLHFQTSSLVLPKKGIVHLLEQILFETTTCTLAKLDIEVDVGFSAASIQNQNQ